ncbi:MAG: hypothetical protein CMG08_02580 [Candidatus Marinimicrobia bacterium]|nr:hypothetical protein [Candidatus Neomarinimicrobiota bacterium]|tara:strand:- start:1101 stop:1607 length:507 start_codon:yes stop_codon:yes gene_type:complete
MNKIALTLIFSLILTNCKQPSSKTITTVTNQDQKSIAVSKLMKGYVDNNFDGTIISEDCIVRFNNIKLGKEDFVGLAPLHHSMFDNITFPDGWIETTNYLGENWKEGNGETWTGQWTKWTATSKISGETQTNRSHFNYKWENNMIVEINALFSDIWYEKELNAFMEKK